MTRPYQTKPYQTVIMGIAFVGIFAVSTFLLPAANFAVAQSTDVKLKTAKPPAVKTPPVKPKPAAIPFKEDSHPLLPVKIYVVSGTPLVVYYDNLVLKKESSKWKFSTSCKIGHAVKDGWKFDKSNLKPGNYPIKVTVTNEAGNKHSATSQVVVSSPQLKRKSLSIMIVGDSLTNASHYPNRIANHFEKNENLKWKMIGTHKPRAAQKEVVHEGYGGRAFPWFVRHYEPKPDGTSKKRSSPFVFMQSDGKPKLDIKQYFEKTSQGEKPDVITILLGINDCFTASTNPEKRTAEKIRWMFENAEILIAEMEKVCPNAKIGMCITPPANSRQSAFYANYKEKYPRDGWVQVLRVLQKKQIDYVKKHKNKNLSIIPIQLNLDTTDGFPENNAVHPNKVGYAQIGDSIYAWLCAQEACN